MTTTAVTTTTATTLRAVLSKASKSVTPTSSEEMRLLATAKDMLDRVKTAAGHFPEVRGIHLGGSFAKGTWLPKDVDLDIFVRFDEDLAISLFEDFGLAIGERAVRGYPHGKKYAQHPYTEAVVEGVKVNIVPCYDVEPGNWKSAADRSLYHVEFVNENLTKSDKLQVRLLKRFMKVVGVYGAEIENEGFSGYATEVMVHAYEGFEGALRHFANMRLISEGASFSLKDPVDSRRELGTAVSEETLARMILVSRAFLESPKLSYFKGIRTRLRRQLTSRLYCIVFEHPALSEDTLWGELKKSTRQFVKKVEAEGFAIARAAPISNSKNRSAIVLLPEVAELTEIVQRVGPKVDLAEEVKRFASKNGRKAELIWAAGDGRLHVLQKRKFTSLRSLLQDLCDERIQDVGVSRDLELSIKRSGRILVGEAVEQERLREQWFHKGVDSIVSDTLGTY